MNIPIGTPTTRINIPKSPKAPKLPIPGTAAPAELAAMDAACKPNARIGPTISIIKKISIPPNAEVISAKGTIGTFLISFKSSKPSFTAPIFGTRTL